MGTSLNKPLSWCSAKKVGNHTGSRAPPPQVGLVVPTSFHQFLWIAITFLSILYSIGLEVLSCGVVLPLCDVVLSLCGEVLSLCNKV